MVLTVRPMQATLVLTDQWMQGGVTGRAAAVLRRQQELVNPGDRLLDRQTHDIIDADTNGGSGVGTNGLKLSIPAARYALFLSRRSPGLPGETGEDASPGLDSFPDAPPRPCLAHRPSFLVALSPSSPDSNARAPSAAIVVASNPPFGISVGGGTGGGAGVGVVGGTEVDDGGTVDVPSVVVGRVDVDDDVDVLRSVVLVVPGRVVVVEPGGAVVTVVVVPAVVVVVWLVEDVVGLVVVVVLDVVLPSVVVVVVSDDPPVVVVAQE